MMDNGKISARQLSILIMLYCIGSAIIVIPSTLASQAKQDAWISSLLSPAIGLLVLQIAIRLSNRFPGMALTEYIEIIFGKWVGKIVSLWFLATFPFMIGFYTLRDIGDFLTMQIMPETPIEAIHIVLFGVIIVGVRLGLEPLARTAELLFPWIVALFAVLFLFIVPQVSKTNLLPVLENGWKPVIRASLPYVSFPFLEPVIFLMLVNHVNRSEKVGRALFTGLAMAGFLMFITTLITILLFGGQLTSLFMYPTYELSKKINIGNFLQRIEIIMATIWFVTIYFRLAILFYVSVVGFARVMKAADYRFLTLPLGMITIVMSLVVYRNVGDLTAFIPVWASFAYINGLLLPALLLIVAVIRKIKRPLVK
ncbi:GerAB/ArcD/ProY family transporter [Cohnella panacarvi]|uniref:GerAB/ArcD/ProY family transporter n=1 Tax=Cohnella panacarvi TaxID=400776 RepID=UPI00047B3E21|nr:endospore germination permease [Cohnella panacarvi]